MKEKKIIVIILFAILCFSGLIYVHFQGDNHKKIDDQSVNNENKNFSLEELFRNPPENAKPWVMWWWQDGNVTKEGIKEDLEAMSSNGIGGVYLFTISNQRESSVIVDRPAVPLTNYWWEMIRYAAEVADSLGLKIALNACDGWATAAAPEITPELSMQKLVWSETKITGGTVFNEQLQQPQTNLGYYRDIAVWAIPLHQKYFGPLKEEIPEVTTNIPGIDLNQLKKIDGFITTDKPGWIQYYYKKPLICRSITISGTDYNLYNAFNCQLDISNDGTNWESSFTLKSPLLGGLQDNSITYSIKPTNGHFFRFTFDKTEFVPKNSKLKFSTGWVPGYHQASISISRIKISEDPAIEGWRFKNGSTWRQSKSENSFDVPDSLCVKLEGMVNLSDKMQSDGTLKWNVPNGENWLIQRFGYTTTGQKNGPASLKGQGLEVDKFNKASVDIQYNSWFGKAFSKLQESNETEVLVSNHIDSWECQSQNWSPVFRDEFVKRRGYDPINYLPAMTGIPIKSIDVSERFLNDIRLTISELICDNFLGPYAERTHQNGARLSLETIAPIQMADGMAPFGKSDWPLGEFWFQSPYHDKPNDIFDAVHASRIYGKNIVGAEAYTELSNQWSEDPYALKTLGDYNYASGINLFILNAYTHKATEGKPGITFWGGLGTEFTRTQPWWNASKVWFDYLTRTQAILQQGNPVIDVLYYTGEYLPIRALMPDDLNINLPDGYTYNSINRDALLNQVKVENRHLVLPAGIKCRVLVLPEDTHMSPEVARKITQIANAGVIVIGPKPNQSWSLKNYPQCDKEVQEIVREQWQKVRNNITLDEIFKEINLEKDLVFENVDLSFQWREDQGYKSPSMVWCHRIVKGTDIYFISNQEYNSKEVRAKFRITDKIPEIWNAETGEIRRISQWSMEDGHISVPLKFSPAESYFIVFRETGKPNDSSSPNFPNYSDVMSIEGNWDVQLRGQADSPKTIKLDKLTSLHLSPNPKVKYFSGTAIYRNTFQIDQINDDRIFIDLGEVANLAEIYLNGEKVSVLWKPPFKSEITDKIKIGQNYLEIRVSTTWRNGLVGEVLTNLEDNTSNLPNYPIERIRGLPLLKSGLLGPVKIQKILRQ
ncbi:MAG TPA: glycosyl hydrolase [Bacteroidales bacterium]